VTAEQGTWFEVADAANIPSPALLVYLERVDENLRRMVATVGSPARLRPHIKTHKMPRLIARQLALGIAKFKCATIAEAEMAAGADAPDVLLACQPVGPNARRLIQLCQRFPKTRLLTIADDGKAIEALAECAAAGGQRLEVLLDLDIGQHRTGIAPGPEAARLYAQIAAHPALVAGGLHAYDGHLDDRNLAARQIACEKAFAPVEALRRTLLDAGLPVPRIVVGGSPTFPIHARRAEVECSPGTCVFWDAGYTFKLPDCDFLPAALLLTRVISKPAANRLCLDLGHKAVASEMPHPRVKLLTIPDAAFVGHSEEHLVIETSSAARFAVGDVLYAMPWHICPTVALHAEAWVISNGQSIDRWPVTARARRLSV
jgi:D-serine deaminase-like pyridoxal phosphate-dependent protein